MSNSKSESLVPQTFFFNSNLVRTVVRGDEPLWVAQDVCDALDLKGDAGQHLRRLAEDEKGLISIQTLGGPQEMLVVNESGLYLLVFRSRKPEADAFRRWLAHEVLPTLRRTGTYSMPGSDVRQLVAKVDELQGTVVALQVQQEQTLAWAHSQRAAKQPTRPTRQRICNGILHTRYNGGCPLHESPDVPRVVEADGQESAGACWLHWVGIQTARLGEMILCCHKCWAKYALNQFLRVTQVGAFVEFHRVRVNHEVATDGPVPEQRVLFGSPDDIIGPDKRR